MKLARSLPAFGNLIIVEMTLSIGIIAIVIACILPNYGIAVKKVMLSELFSFFFDVKVDRMVNMAVTGDGYFPDSSAPKISDKSISSKMEIREKAIGNNTRYEGSLGEPFYLTFAPSVIAEGPIGTVLWLCGNKKPPAGWTQPIHAGTDLPPEVLPFVCRDL
jgi:hypothetical protein